MRNLGRFVRASEFLFFILGRVTPPPYNPGEPPAEYVISHTATADMYLAGSGGQRGKYIGTIKLEQLVSYEDGDNVIRFTGITGTLKSILPAGSHGFHIHENKADEACSSLGGHYNPLSANHGPPDGKNRHVGDLGNIVSNANGDVRLGMIDNIIQVGTTDRTYDIVGRSLAIHVSADDWGQGGKSDSLTAGNSGRIMACGNIVLRTNLLTTAIAKMYSAASPGQSLGTVYLRQYQNVTNGKQAFTVVVGNLVGIMPPQAHGFHIYEARAPSSCSSLTNHYNPTSGPHGGQKGVPIGARHLGDLGNIISDAKGNTNFDIVDQFIQIGTKDPIYDVVGRTIGVTMNRDDLGLGGNQASSANGNSGSVIACGNIEIQPGTGKPGTLVATLRG